MKGTVYIKVVLFVYVNNALLNLTYSFFLNKIIELLYYFEA